MRIGIISDTHMPEVAKSLPEQIKEAFSDVDLILHAGDVYVISVLDELEQLAPVLAAEGDDDSLEQDERVKDKHVLTIEGLRLWLTHDTLPKFRILPQVILGDMRSGVVPGSVLQQLPEPPDILVCGHTHHPKVDNHEGVLLINPGSATFPGYKRKPGTVAILTINSGKPEVHIVQLRSSGCPKQGHNISELYGPWEIALNLRKLW